MNSILNKSWIAVSIPSLCILMTACKQKGPEMTYKTSVVNALEDVEDKASADDAAKTIEEAKREYKKDRIDMEQSSKRFLELRKQIRDKNYYDSEALADML